MSYNSKKKKKYIYFPQYCCILLNPHILITQLSAKNYQYNAFAFELATYVIKPLTVMFCHK